MTNILERVANSGRPFVPRSPLEYLALQIARKMQAIGHVREYAILLENYPEGLIVRACRACRGDPGHELFLKAFRAVIEQPDP